MIAKKVEDVFLSKYNTIKNKIATMTIVPHRRI